MSVRAVPRMLLVFAAGAFSACDAGGGSPAAPSTPGAGAVTQAGAGASAPPAGNGGTNALPQSGSGGVAGAAVPPAAGGSGGGGGSGGNGDAGSDAAIGGDDAGPGSDAAATFEPKVIVPSATWPCGMPDGIPVPAGEPVLTAQLDLGETLDLGQTQYGMRRVLPIDGGTFTGAEIRGDFMTGGLDWELTLPSGAIEVEARLLLRTDDGQRIYLRVCGVRDAAAGNVRIVPDFEAASSGAYDWLNDGPFVGTREVSAGTMRLSVYRADAPPADAAREPTPEESDPALPRQAWDCGGPAAPADMSAQVFQAPVRIGSIISIGASKYGSRTVIPITGGTFSGSELAGDVIPGGADFQLTPAGGSLQIEARYTLRTDDGALISVRNCGGGGGTTPQFETARDGAYAWLTQERFSGTIGLAVGGVLITVYRTQ